MAGILYYAFGGGLGHLTRARAVRHTLGLDGPFTVLCSSPFACDPRIVDDLSPWVAPKNLELDSVAFRAWIQEAMDRFRPDAFFVDAFPGGILGELCGFPFPKDLELVHIGRILRCSVYSALLDGPLPRFRRTWLVESIPEEQERVLARISLSVEQLELRDPPTVPRGANPEALRTRWNGLGKPIWLVVHSGPDDETKDLVAYARECAAAEGVFPHFVLASPGASPVECVEHIDLHPASRLFPHVDRIVTAAGFNSIRQTKPWRSKHLCLPFPRRLDDQFLRKRLTITESV